MTVFLNTLKFTFKKYAIKKDKKLRRNYIGAYTCA